jgi:RND superfamily putative drug exporter
VLVDAFVVRMTLTPALMHLLGEKAWWIPRWLDRVLPNVDVEGATLARTLEARAEAGRVAEPAGRHTD